MNSKKEFPVKEKTGIERVVVDDFDISFFRLVNLIVKFWLAFILATVVALVVLIPVFLFFSLLIVAIFSGSTP